MNSHYLTLIMNSGALLTIIVLLPPIIMPKPSMILTTKLVKISMFISLIPLTIYLNENMETTLTMKPWMDWALFNIALSFKIDKYTVIFTPIALMITWSIMEFSQWYMAKERHMDKFFKYLLLFLITMITFISANNLLQLFIGWEGVGIMSFLLISWWSGRTKANISALQAVAYNRIGDIGLMMSMVWMCSNTNSWDLQQITMLLSDQQYLIPTLGFLIAATGKSAQFGLHPWLPAAMEGPTPVSALLHSSTMVVAGVFLLIRLHPLFQNYPLMLEMTLCLGAMTTICAALCATTQNDIKKIIAFSTSSQLGLMMVAVGLNHPHIAFLHMCTHAFFKAMLFLCSGSIIHNMNNEQDIRKFSCLNNNLPLTTTCMTIGSAALMGLPFLAGFFTKDLILEALNTSYTNAWALMVTLMAVTLTTAYSSRLIIMSASGTPRYLPLTPTHENNFIKNPLKRLAWGSLISGLILTSTLPPMKPQIFTMPTYIKTIALMMFIISLIISMELTNKKINQTTFSFFTQLAFYPHIIHRLTSHLSLIWSQKLMTQVMDVSWLEKIGPKGLANHQLKPSTTLTEAHHLNSATLPLMAFALTLITLSLTAR
ncbi:NADH dehydrogenase subunit 5 (mitochondrion) [Petromyzon marinus]|uniref:NADH-ubiquinone oxidoreductase chain 5 n=1 Tax=Petromyzon marinus TaxID=7757 RepID=NU5M_PETMA|nr:NADH dehydrogenase subunit 5 [Petromyzon marinus]Q35543.1 RecName: Full=NADH-ubiquinone oxidoreductase chain 5; AltName: Full=NADH dehydrogenase subunit 5 [Petromyzon marinus]AAB08748.1 NADH dehydrogenase subunit 5 [Petromyzon marinus]